MRFPLQRRINFWTDPHDPCLKFAVLQASMASLSKDIGFIGLGIMGLPMATNLASKMAGSSKLFVYDISSETSRRLQDDLASGRVHICQSSQEVAEKAVGSYCSPSNTSTHF